MFSVCALLYGDYPDLARKLLNSLRILTYVQDVRLGLNQVSAETQDCVHRWASEQCRHRPVYLYGAEDGSNLGKYPLMRQMLRDRTIADKVMWFDDDSYLDAAVGTGWWEQADAIVRNKTQIGALHWIMQRGRQHEVIKRQPWFTGKPINARHRFHFATGGWWVAKSRFLLDWDYPFPALHHNGGDSILGELIRQQGGTLGSFPVGMQCHCEGCARRGSMEGRPVVHINVGGRKGRRGLGVTNERYVWADGNPAPSLSHQHFKMKVTRYEV